MMDLIPATLAPDRPSSNGKPFAANREQFIRAYQQACTRNADPFWACSLACPKKNCLFRHHAARLLPERHLSETFDEALARAGERTQAAMEIFEEVEIWDDLQIIDQAVFRLVGYQAHPEVQRSAGLCYAIQWMAGKRGMLDRARRTALQSLIEAVDRRGFTQE